MLIENIKLNENLNQLLVEECCENDVGVTFADDIKKEDYIIIKVDKFYNSLGLGDTPASLDCLIIRKCLNIGFGLTLVELKDIDEARRFSVENLKAKFENTINDFMRVRFKDLLFKEYKDIKLYFVSNIENYRRDNGLKTEALINLRFDYGGKKLMIRRRMPHPTITNCQ